MTKTKFFMMFSIVLMFVVPAIGLDFDLSGSCIVEHYMYSNETMNKKDATNSYSSMELMFKPILIINDNIKLSAEFTALQDHVWGTDSQPKFQQDNPLLPIIDSSNNIDWKSAYMTLKTGIGGFLIGRGIEKKWGTGLGDTTGSHGSNSKQKDGVLWVVPIGHFISGLGWQHIIEGDKGYVISDADFDKTYIFSAIKKDRWNAGLLLARYDHKNFVTIEELRDFQRGYLDFQNAISEFRKASAVFGIAYRASEHMENEGYYDLAGVSNAAEEEGYNSVTRWDLETPGEQITDASSGVISMPDLNELMLNADVAQALATSVGAKIKDGPERSTLALWVFDPYFIYDFGLLKIEAEFLCGWGTIELDEPKFSSESAKVINTVDVNGLAGTFGVWYKLSNLMVGTGSTYVQGDYNSYDDGKFSGIGYLEPSIDFERGFLLTSDVSRIESDLGGIDSYGCRLGNLSGGPLGITGPFGYKMFWIESKYFFSDNIELDILCVGSHADDPPEGWDSNHGIEYDFEIKWKIMKNLTFNGTFAYLNSGDFWKASDYNKEIKNVNALHGRILLEF